MERNWFHSNLQLVDFDQDFKKKENEKNWMDQMEWSIICRYWLFVVVVVNVVDFYCTVREQQVVYLFKVVTFAFTKYNVWHWKTYIKRGNLKCEWTNKQLTGRSKAIIYRCFSLFVKKKEFFFVSKCIGYLIRFKWWIINNNS